MTDAEDYHTRQYDKPYESTAAFADFIRSVTGYPTLSGRVLDVGCGAGANIHWLDEWGVTQGCEVTGIDTDKRLLDFAQVNNPTRSFLNASFLDPLPPCETALSIQVLSFIEDWRPAVRELLHSAKERIFISSLFWEGVGTHTHASDNEKVNAHYNVIDTVAFTELVERFGGKVIRWRASLPTKALHGPPEVLRSRTVGTMTMSGPLLMPWRMVAVGRA